MVLPLFAAAPGGRIMADRQPGCPYEQSSTSSPWVWYQPEHYWLEHNLHQTGTAWNDWTN